MINKLYAVTVTTKPGGYYDCLYNSCKYNNIKLVTLGWNKKWKGFAWRFGIFNKFLNTLND